MKYETISPRRWLRRWLEIGAVLLVLTLLAWCLLPKPSIYPPGLGWSRVVADRHGAVLHLSTAADGRYRQRTPLARVSPQWIEVALADDGLPRPLAFSAGSPQVPAGTPLLSPQARFLVLDMLRGGAGLGSDYGFGKSDPAVAWKTGTSHGFRDAWAVGVRGDYVLVVWPGNFNGWGHNALVARKCAAPLLFDLFARLHLPDREMVPPDGVRQVELCAASGDLPGPWCHQTTHGWFIPGVSPISLCQLHREILVDGSTGKRVARDDGRPGLRRQIHEFWPPDPESGTCTPGDSLPWKSMPGNHQLRVLDDHGRTAEAAVRVNRM